MTTTESERSVNAQVALKNYASIKVNAAAQGASSHQLITMLYDGLLERISQTKGAIEQKNIELKGLKINQAVSIVTGLREALNQDANSDIAGNLDNIYDYVQRRLREAHRTNDLALLDECYELIETVSDGWKQIEAEVH